MRNHNNPDPDPPFRSGLSFEEILGKPDAFPAALGHVLLAMDDLRDTVRRGISHALQQQTAPPAMPFAVQVDLLVELINETPREQFEPGDYSPAKEMAELAAKCHHAEVLWRSFLLQDLRDDYFRRAAIALASAPNVPKRTWSELEEQAAATQDAADDITSVAADLDNFLGSWTGPPRNRRPFRPRGFQEPALARRPQSSPTERYRTLRTKR